MSYIRADMILPRELIEAIQQYVDGKSIYIPRKEKREWGSGTDPVLLPCGSGDHFRRKETAG